MITERFSYDGWHDVADQMPKPNIQLHIECDNDNIGGAGMFCEDGKWYWTWDGQPDEECKFTVTRWSYLS